MEDFQARVKRHGALIGPYADNFLKQRSLHLKHPVYDFLFTYYPFSPLKLKQWVPSFEQAVEIEVIEEFPWLEGANFIYSEGVLTLNRARFSPSARGLAEFVVDLCDRISTRVPRYGCFGLHEWAMVYNLTLEEVRHTGHSLRLNPAMIKTFVDNQSLGCTHYDAYRFFTPEAKLKNKFQPTLDSRKESEQGGCIHANMDIYKWATKLWPWTGSDFIGKAFRLALHGRELDMRASPYDLSEVGFIPIPIETEAGRKVYQQEQIIYAEQSKVLREELRNLCFRLLNYC